MQHFFGDQIIFLQGINQLLKSRSFNHQNPAHLGIVCIGNHLQDLTDAHALAHFIHARFHAVMNHDALIQLENDRKTHLIFFGQTINKTGIGLTRFNREQLFFSFDRILLPQTAFQDQRQDQSNPHQDQGNSFER